jgi:hypothetical protein
VLSLHYALDIVFYDVVFYYSYILLFSLSDAAQLEVGAFCLLLLLFLALKIFVLLG